MAKKYFKKALSMGLALTMCLSLAAPAFAEDVPENPYQEQINTANKVKEDADEAKKDSNIYWSAVDQQLEIAGGKNADATDKSTEVKDTVDKVEGDVSKVVTDQQALADAAEKAANGQITDAASTITGETEKVSAAVDEANKAVESVTEKLEALKDETLTPEQKVEAAQEAQAAADTAVQAAADAAKVVETAQETVDAAVKAAEDAKAAYDAAVQAAQKAVGDAKAAALAELEAAKATLEAAKTDLADATTAKETAERAKKSADGALKTAQDMLQAAQKAYNGEWPEDSGFSSDKVKQDAIDAQNETATQNEKSAEMNEKVADRLGQQITADTTVRDEKNEEKEDKEAKVGDLNDDVIELNDEQEMLETAKGIYDDKVKEAEDAYWVAIQAQRDEYIEAASKNGADLAVDGSSDGWAVSQVALKDENGGWKDHLTYNGNPVSNYDFPYILKAAELRKDTAPEEYERLQRYFEQWKEETKTSSKVPGENAYYKAIVACEVAAGVAVGKINDAATTLNSTIQSAESNLLNTTKRGSVQAVTDRITEVPGIITGKENEIKTLGEAITVLDQEIRALNSKIKEATDTKESCEEKAEEQRTAAETARRAAQKLTDLLALKVALAAAEAALYQAQEAQAAAAERQAEAQKKLDAYNDAQEAVEEAKKALEAKLSGDLESGKLSLTAGADFDADLAELEAKLKEAQDAAKEAEENYNKAKEDADKAKEDAENAKKDADEAKEDADRELEDFNDRYVGGDTGGADDADDAGDPDDTGVEIDDEAIPLSNGPVTRAQFVDYLWRHEGSPAAESELFADHEYAPAIAWALSVEIIGEDFQPDELATVADVRAILGSFARVFGSNAVDAADLTTLAGEDGEAVMNCAQVLAEFFGEEYDIPEDLDNLEIDDEA